jgi:serine/threonine protein kinase
LTGEEVVSLIIGLAGAPAVVHHAGIVHRDIKPANVLLRLSGTESSRSGRLSWTSASHTSSTQPASPRPES